MGQQNNQNQQQDINQLLKVRREKLADLQEKGKDPFQITKYEVTYHSQEIKDNFDKLECGHDEEGKLIREDSKLAVEGIFFLFQICHPQHLMPE